MSSEARTIPLGDARRFVCYLAGPIDQVDEAPGLTGNRYRADRTTLRSLLAEAGFAVYAPHAAWSGVSLARDTCSAVAEVNDRALVTADALVAMLPTGIPTRGTFAEIEQAAQDGIPTVAVASDPPPSHRFLPGVIWVKSSGEALNTVEAWRERGLLGTRGKPAHPYEPEPPVIPPVAYAGSPTDPLAFTMERGVGDWALPTRHYPDDAAFDLYVTSNQTINHGEFADIAAGCQVELPEGTFGMIVGRSSTIRKRGLLVVTGIIDVGYRGDLFVGTYNVSGCAQSVHVGDRIGQLLILPNLAQRYAPTKVDMLSASERGTAGFGSTGGYRQETANG